MIVAIDVGLKRVGVAISPDGNNSFTQIQLLEKVENQAF